MKKVNSFYDEKTNHCTLFIYDKAIAQEIIDIFSHCVRKEVVNNPQYSLELIESIIDLKKVCGNGEEENNADPV